MALQIAQAPRRSMTRPGAALTPRGDATLVLCRLRDVWETPDSADRAYLAPALRELVDGAPAEAS